MGDQSPLCCHCTMIPSMPALIPTLSRMQLQRNDLRQSLIQQELIVGTLTQNLVHEQKKLEILLNLKRKKESETLMSESNFVSNAESQSRGNERINDDFWSLIGQFKEEEDPMNEESFQIEDLVVEEVTKYRKERLQFRIAC